ncbi:MAG TPA: aminotransferase class III-fold pyridoxal phosphate-dependent enzyme [Candidatus Faecousia intestinigallinarum]|nr:aminotransferase class III-fold pyridoxal phosphate-dependent enzyme [Candidatus Faecousia intestinigallinarum]
MSKYPEYDHSKSRAWFDRALNVIPSGIYGHLGPSEGLFLPLEKWPLISSKAKGTYFWDMDGNRYLDFMCAYGPNVLGYGDADVDRAAMEQLMAGNCTTAPSYKMVECAELLTDTVACADWAFFMKNGTDATTFGVLTARAATGKKKTIFLKGYYHGNQPWAMKADYPGILPEEVANNIIVPWFDLDALEQAYLENGGDIAALIAQPYDHGNFADNRCATKEYWAAVRKFCTKHGIVLIIDDVRAGFRLDLAGSDHYYGFEADIICFCKALANGYNMSAACGKEFLRPAASSLSYTGSYWMSAEPFAACIACLNKMKALDTPALFRRLGEQLTAGLRDAGKTHGFDLVVSGEPALFYLRIANDDSLMLHQEWVAACVSRGLFLTSHHNHFLNAAVTQEDIALAVDIADDAFSVVAQAHPELDFTV